MFQPTRHLMMRVLIFYVFCDVFFELYRFLYGNAPKSNLCGTQLETVPKFLEPIQNRLEIGSRLEREEFKIGAELGVKEGFFARDTLKSWPGATEYVLVDVWATLGNYADVANMGDREVHYESAIRETAPWKEKVRVCRNFTTVCVRNYPDNYFDYIYVDARHDRKGAALDLEEWWPKLKVGGIFAGHDYVAHGPQGGQGWDLNFDGTVDPEGLNVKGAVDDFSVQVERQVQIVYNEVPSQFWTWVIRK
mmetsp:Transcript_13458/g.54393  ORF Transcript_13458/g.54393 Transcript_13458/m.54393 type:complete len:249 (-) Transcript_13458:1704-2450(-)